MDKLQQLAMSDLACVLNMKNSRPYVFRTRLERALQRTKHFAENNSRNDLVALCNSIKEKLHYISDQSNQTSDGTLKSFLFLQQDIEGLLGLLK